MSADISRHSGGRQQREMETPRGHRGVSRLDPIVEGKPFVHEERDAVKRKFLLIGK